MHGHRIIIPALRPAPIQVNYLGYPGTTGAAFMDYILADRIVLPPEHQSFYAEKVVYLPHTYQVTDPAPRVSRLGLRRADCGLPAEGTVFCSFCTDYKIEKQSFSAWMEILKAAPDSVLWLLVRTETAAANLRRAARQVGVDPGRLVFADPRPKDQHLERLCLADLALDTFTVNGHTTTSDALWAGVPVITLQGKHFASRVASSLLHAMGLKALVLASIHEYIDFAVYLAQEKSRLALLKEKVRFLKQDSPLFDISCFAQSIEAAFRMMWAIHLRGNSPRSFDVTCC
jgi:predicted O-linked N-acetylglucosamine transferase (SPINDLY family)